MPLRDTTEVRNEELGPLAKRLRKQLGPTVKAVAEDMTVSRSALSRAESGDPKLYSLALRAVNHLAEVAAEQGKMEAGRILTRHLAYGSVVDQVGALRAPERTRFAGMLRMALLPFGLKLDVEQEPGTAVIYSGVESGWSVHVDLDQTRVRFWDGRGDRYVGHIISLEMLDGERDEEREAAQIFAFTVALNEASLGTDAPLDMTKLKGFVDFKSRHAHTPRR